MVLHSRLLAASCVPLLVAACSPLQLSASVDAGAPPAWREPAPLTALPHQGDPARLQQWWSEQGDPLLARLVEAAQHNSPSLAAARTRMAQAGADQAGAQASLRPRLDAQAGVERESVLETGRRRPDLASTAHVGLQASWDLDISGGHQAQLLAARLRASGAQESWHAARVAVAAETAQYYFAWRHCRQQLDLMREDLQAQQRIERLGAAMTGAGMAARVASAQEGARSAEGVIRLADADVRCNANIKSLVALTALDEPQLRTWLAQAGELPEPDAAAFRIDALPAQILRQRPDVLIAESAVAAASADFDHVQRARYPRLSLKGTIGLAKSRSGGAGAGTFTTWSLGPLELEVPLYDGGAHSAAVDAAHARYDEAVAQYRASVRHAVSEVENALLELNAGNERGPALATLSGSKKLELDAAQAAYRAGLGSEAQWQQARRAWLAGRVEEGERHHQRRIAWLTLYRAVGGSWRQPG